MNGSRRTFLGMGSKVGLGALLSGALPLKALARRPSSPPAATEPGNFVETPASGDQLSRITSAMFADNLNSKFTFKLGAVKLADMTLESVDDQTPDYLKATDSTREMFLLVFQGPRSLPLAQDTYTVVHYKLGTFALFIVPGNQSNKSGLRYTALINRLYS